MLRISQKIILSFAILMVISFLAMLYSTSQIKTIRDLSTGLAVEKETLEGIRTNIELRFTEYHLGTESMLSILDNGLLNDKYNNLRITQAEIFALLQKLERKKPEIFSNLTIQIYQKLAAYSENQERLYKLVKNFAQMQANDLFKNDLSPLGSMINQDIQLIKTETTIFFLKREQEVEQNIQHIQMISFTKVTVLLFAYVLTGFLLWNGSILPIVNLTQYLKSNKEKAADKVPFSERNDEIGDFARAYIDELSERVSAEEELKAQAQQMEDFAKQAKEANEAKSEFLANMSHELRTPLNAIKGMVELLSLKLRGDQKDMLNILQTSSDNLLKIVNDILDLSKIEAGAVELENIPFNFQKEVETVFESLKPIASKKDLDLFFHNKIDAPYYVLGDPLRFSRIIINLTNNAINYTREGRVTIKLTEEQKANENAHILIEVIDTGIGIDADRVDQIFEKFVQEDGTTTRQYGGTGLGLAITKELVELMGGQIGVRSRKGVGSTFWVKMPLTIAQETDMKEFQEAKASNAANAARATALPEDHKRIKLKDTKFLLAEDNEMNIRFMEHLFKNFGVKDYKIVNDGEAALHEVQAQNYDIVLMDWNMPKMNGRDATRKIRQLQNEKKSQTPIIAMTANVMDRDVERCFEAGMDGYIGKPFTVNEFREKISHWVEV